MSELSPIGTFTSDYNIKSGSVGPLVSNTFGKIIDPKTGKSLAPYQPGELVIKVKSQMNMVCTRRCDLFLSFIKYM